MTPICDRCYRPIDQGDHGLYLCPLQPRRAAAVRPDNIPGGVLIEHGICNDDGTPRRYDSYSAIDRACAEKGYRRWSEYYSEDRTKPAREQMEWQQSGEATRLRKQNEDKAREQTWAQGEQLRRARR